MQALVATRVRIVERQSNTDLPGEGVAETRDEATECDSRRNEEVRFHAPVSRN